MPGCWAQGAPYPDFRTAVQGRLQGGGDVQAKTHGRSRIGPFGEMAGPGEGVQRPRADRRRGQGKSRCQTSKGIVSQAKEPGLSPGTAGYLQLVSRGEWCLRKVTLPVVRSEIGEGAPGADSRPGMMELKRGWIHWVVPNQKRDSWGSWGGGIGKAEPLPIAISRRGQAVSPSSVLLPQPRTCQQPPETSPRRGDCEARRLMDLHLGAAPPRQPRTR